MKKFRFFGRRGLSVILSLALCMGLASPAFAAMDLKDALDGNGGWRDVSERGDAFTDENGNSTGTKENYYLSGDLQLEETLEITGDRDVTIDLKGQTLKHTGETGSVIEVNNGAELTIEDASGKDKDGKYVSGGEGKITGGKGCPGSSSWGAGIAVSDSTLTLNGGNITENGKGSENVVSAGGGVLVRRGTLNINNGSISYNEAGQYGGGVYADSNSTVKMTGGAITGNRVTNGDGGGGIDVDEGTFTMSGGIISDNVTTYGVGGGVALGRGGKASMTMTGGTISGNSAAETINEGGYTWGGGGGIYLWENGSLKMTGGKIIGNSAPTGSAIYANSSSSNSASVEISGGVISKNQSWDGGKAVFEGHWDYTSKKNVEYTDKQVVTIGDDVIYCGNGDGINHHGDSETTNKNGIDMCICEVCGGVISGSVPEGGTVTNEDGSETTYPAGGTLNVDDGSISTEGDTVTKKVNEDGTVTITTDPKDGEKKDNVITLPEGSTKDDVKVNGETGNTTIPGGSKINSEDGETTYPNGAVIDKDGNVIGESVTKGEDEDGNTVITSKDDKGDTKAETTVDVPADKKGEVEVDGKTGNTDIPGGSSIEDRDENGKKTETTYPDGAIIDPEGNVTSKGDTVTKTEKDDGTVDVSKEDKDGNKTEIKVESKDPAEGEEKEDLKINDDGSVDIPEGGKTTDGEGTETTYPDGGKVNPDGTVDGNGSTVTKDKDGNVTITDGEGSKTEVKPGESGEGIKVNPDGTVEVPAGGSVTKPDGTTTDLPYGGIVDKNGNVTENENPNPETPDPEQPDVPAPGGDDDFGGAADAGTTINEAEVPLAGIVLVKDVLAELYKHAGSPDGEDAEGEYVKAIAWAIANGIVDADYDVDAVVTVAVLKEMLTNYAGELKIAIDGENDDVVLNCGEILEKFFQTL